MRAPAWPRGRRLAILAAIVVFPGLARAACLSSNPVQCEVERLRYDLQTLEIRLRTCEAGEAHNERMFDAVQAQIDSISDRLLAVELRVVTDPPKAKRK